MANKSDAKVGRVGRGSKLSCKRAMEERKEEEAEVEKETNFEIGNFVSELTTAIRYREMDGLDSGDWIEEPERMFTDGLLFAEETKAATEGKLQITVTLDASNSMWKSWLMETAAPTFRAIIKMLTLAQQELPPGTLTFAPFIFHEQAFRIPPQLADQFTQGAFKKTARMAVGFDDYTGKANKFESYETKNYFLPGEGVALDKLYKAACEGEYGEPPEDLRKVGDWYKLYQDQDRYPEAYAFWKNIRAGWEGKKMVGLDTLLAPLFKAIEQWEADKDHSAARLDIVITDGNFENEADLREASQIQERRNGQLTTVLLNFLKPQYWTNVKLPDRCLQYPVDRQNIDASIRNVIMEAVSVMMG